MTEETQRTHDFGPFRLDAGNHCLLRDGEVVALKPKAFDTLLTLIEMRGRVVSKDELMRRLWPDTVVEEASLTQNIYEVRKALGDADRLHRYIENVPKRGYRFLAEVRKGGVEARRSIAVLPFRISGGAADSEHLGFGFADSVTAALARLRELAVRPSSATSKYTGATRDPHQAARELSVAFIVDGSVQMRNDDVRVTVQLVDVASGTTFWADRFDGLTGELFALQDAIATKLALAIAPELTRRRDRDGSERYTPISEAHELYMKGRYHWNKATPAALAKALRFFNAAVQADPRYALAHVGIADVYTSLDWYGVLSTRDSNPAATAAAERALEIDDSLAEAHASLGMARQYAWNWPAAENEYRTAIALDPYYAQAHQWYAVFLGFMGRFDESIDRIKRAEALDPASISIASQVALMLLCARKYEEAALQTRKALELEPQSVETLFYAGMVDEQLGNFADAARTYAALPPDNPDFRAMLAHASGLAGDVDTARAIIRELESDQHEQHIALFWLALAYLGVGDKDAALSTLERACDDPDDSLLSIRVFPALDPIRSAPRFTKILERMYLVESSESRVAGASSFD